MTEQTHKAQNRNEVKREGGVSTTRERKTKAVENREIFNAKGGRND
uniref:Uncharacterized protein n=1 Tax=Anguilla anguilla TaxID=7936 RepID=A0A0E9R073_ANGAN